MFRLTFHGTVHKTSRNSIEIIEGEDGASYSPDFSLKGIPAIPDLTPKQMRDIMDAMDKAGTEAAIRASITIEWLPNPERA